MNNCQNERNCFTCGHHQYDSFHNEQHCDKHIYCEQVGYGSCDDWICQYRLWCEESDMRNQILKTQLDEMTQLYHAEKLLRQKAEKLEG
jgi:hypothetical protein